MPPSTNITVQAVAREAAVSKTTAASILRNQRGFQVSEATQSRVLAAAEKLGYRRNALAVALSSGRTHTVGILLPPLHPGAGSAITHTFSQRVFVSLFTAAGRAGLRVIPTSMAGTESDQQLSVRDLANGWLDGVILVSLRDRQFVEEVYASGLPCVEMSSGFGARLIHPDNEGGAVAAVTHLTGLGHRRIAHWRGGNPDNHATVQRLSGFLSVAAAHGLTSEIAPVVDSADALTALLRLPAGERPTAVFAFNDHQAFMTLDIARGLGLHVPADLSVVGFDNSIVAELARPALTTVHNSLDEQAEAAVAVLQALWRGEPDPPLPPALPTRLVVRQSTAPPPTA